MDLPRVYKVQLQCWIVGCCLGVVLAGSQIPEAQAQVEATTPTPVEEWLAQSTVQITGVQINPTEIGVEIRLETAANQQPAITTSVSGNALIADIPDAVLALPEGDSFEQFNPTEEIALVTISPRGTGIRVVVTGTNAPPIAEVSSTAGTLVLQVVPGLAQAEGADDAIQIVATDEAEAIASPVPP
ncbi:MAG: AMIN domain-containing protein [Leptolyngbyaceae cyanobacterium RM2_2_4]|nr:AMIN domain-containing protein [Leptolyngbyaceae cyanobacterium SM1_4_3]NJN88868.1 AMIN domain-containing protein [Leptolyngbyaceae cyanobacterium SL_7_1]NJO48762.1 AMIN domain-containing protein [Leptolyngbyaceae cyanobacterium RM2_2_4]